MDLHGRNLLKEIDLTAEEFLYLVHLAGTLRTEGPKVEAACRFVEATGGMAAIGRLDDAEALLDGKAGTIVVPADARSP